MPEPFGVRRITRDKCKVQTCPAFAGRGERYCAIHWTQRFYETARAFAAATKSIRRRPATKSIRRRRRQSDGVDECHWCGRPIFVVDWPDSPSGLTFVHDAAEPGMRVRGCRAASYVPGSGWDDSLHPLRTARRKARQCARGGYYPCARLALPGERLCRTHHKGRDYGWLAGAEALLRAVFVEDVRIRMTP